MSTIKMLNEINQLCALEGIEVIKITCLDDKMLVQSHDVDKTIFVEATLIPCSDFVGEFGITDLKMLNSCLKFHGTEDVKIRIGTREVSEAIVMDEIEFRGKGAKSIFKLMDSKHIVKQASISSIPWSITIDDLSKDRIKDFTSFAQLYANIDGHFDISTNDGKLILSFGKEASSTHSGTLEFIQVTGELSSVISFPINKFTMMLKLMASNDKSKLLFSNKGLLGVEIETEFGIYRFYLRQIVR